MCNSQNECVRFFFLAQGINQSRWSCKCVCVSVCVCERERERGRQRDNSVTFDLMNCVLTLYFLS